MLSTIDVTANSKTLRRLHCLLYDDHQSIAILQVKTGNPSCGSIAAHAGVMRSTKA